jgi:nitrogen fixation NifU-like protein
MSMQSRYEDLIIEHSRRPIGAGLREPFEVEVHHVNPTCGDEVTLRVHLEGDKVADVSYDALGCSISVAGSSVMADAVTGGTVEEAMQRYEDVRAMLHDRTGEPDPDRLGDAVAFAGVAKFPARVKCALLGWAAMRDALIQALDKTGESA